MSNLQPDSSDPSPRAVIRRRRRRQYDRLIVSGVLAALVAAMVLAGRDLLQSGEPGARSTEQGAGSGASAPVAPRSVLSVPSATPLVDDDGSTLWAAPTARPPLDVSYLPPGPQIIIALRPAALAEHPEGEKVIDAIEPVARVGLQYLSDALPHVAGVTQLLIGCELTGDGSWRVTMVVQLSGHESAADYLTSRLPAAKQKTHGGKNYWLIGQRAYFAPNDPDKLTLVVASEDTLKRILVLDGRAPPLQRDIERILAYSDANRHLTMVAAPTALFTERGHLFGGHLAPLRSAVEWFLGNDVAAACLSMHWDEHFFVELVAVPTLDSSSERKSDEWAARISELPALVEDVVLGLNASPYSRRVVARFPEMVRRFAAYTRHGFEPDHAVLRCYLPAAAGHNLLMGAELTLAEMSGDATLTERPTDEAAAPAGGLPGIFSDRP